MAVQVNMRLRKVPPRQLYKEVRDLVDDINRGLSRSLQKLSEARIACRAVSKLESQRVATLLRRTASNSLGEAPLARVRAIKRQALKS